MKSAKLRFFSILLITIILLMWSFVTRPMVSSLAIVDSRNELETPIDWQTKGFPPHINVSEAQEATEVSVWNFERVNKIDANYVLLIGASTSPRFSHFYRLIDTNKRRLLFVDTTQSEYSSQQLIEMLDQKIPATRLKSLVSFCGDILGRRFEISDDKRNGILNHAMELFKAGESREAQSYAETAVLLGEQSAQAAALNSISAVATAWDPYSSYVASNVKVTNKPNIESISLVMSGLDSYLLADGQLDASKRKEFLQWHASGCLILIAASEILRGFYFSSYPDEAGIKSSGLLSVEEEHGLAELRAKVRELSGRLMGKYDQSEHRWIPVSYSPYFRPDKALFGNDTAYNIYEVIGIHSGLWYDTPEEMVKNYQKWIKGLTEAQVDQLDSLLFNTFWARGFHNKWFADWGSQNQAVFNRAWEGFLSQFEKEVDYKNTNGLDTRLLGHAMRLSGESGKIFVTGPVTPGSNRNLRKYYEAIWEARNLYLWGQFSPGQLSFHYNYIENLIEEVVYEQEEMKLGFNRLKHDLMIEAVEIGTDDAMHVFRLSACKDSVSAYGSVKGALLRRMVFDKRKDWLAYF